LTSSTAIIAPKTPVSTGTPSRRSASTNRSKRGRAASPGIALSKLGRLPRAREPASVNCDTASTAPPASASPRPIRPDSSSNTLSPAIFRAARSTLAASSPRSRPTRSSNPVPIAATVSPSTRTLARLTL